MKRLFVLTILLLCILYCPVSYGQASLLLKKPDKTIAKEQVEKNVADIFSYHDYMDGKYDGQNLVLPIQKKLNWFLGGVVLGPLAVAIPYHIDYENQGLKKNILTNKSCSYTMGFMKGYAHQSVTNNAVAALIGWGTWIIFYFVMTK